MQPNQDRYVKFSTRPEGGPIQARYQLVRTPQGKRARCTILSERVFGVPIHWYRSRSVPHTEPLCDACKAGIPARWKGYLGISAFETGEVMILEVTSNCMDAIDAYYTKHGTLRGAALITYRRGKKDNSPVHAIVSAGELASSALPVSPDVEAALNRIWYHGLFEGRDPHGPGAPDIGEQFVLPTDERIRQSSNGSPKRQASKR